MEVHTIEVNGIEYRFENVARNTHSGFKHTTEVFRDGRYIKNRTVHYINRTWESYRFQSVMRNAISDLMDWEMDNYLDDYKGAHDIKRWNKTLKDEVIKQCREQESYKELQEVMSKL